MESSIQMESWAAQERLRFIERSLWWRAQIKRKDLGELFGISLAQASADLQRYLELNPTAASYDLRGKTYRGEVGMACLLHEPRLEEALGLFTAEGVVPSGVGPICMRFGKEERATDRVSGIRLPARRASLQVDRAAFYAVDSGLVLSVHYGSLTGRRKAGWRRLIPRAFAHDGYRWHVRAWCLENEEYRDFVLSRIQEVEWPTEEAPEDLPRDEAWENFQEIALKVNPDLPEDLRRTLEWDYGMTKGVLRFQVREAMRHYVERHLHLPSGGEKERMPYLVLAEP